jgi:hypothetical protein
MRSDDMNREEGSLKMGACLRYVKDQASRCGGIQLVISLIWNQDSFCYETDNIMFER